MKPKFPEFDPVTESIDLALVDCAKIILEAATEKNGGAYVDGEGACTWIPLLEALGRFAKIVRRDDPDAPVLSLYTQTQRKQEEPNAADDL